MLINTNDIINLTGASHDQNTKNNITPTHIKSNNIIYHNEPNIAFTVSTIALLYEYSLIFIPNYSNFGLYSSITSLYHGVNSKAPTSVISTPEYIPIANIFKLFTFGAV